MSILPVPQAVPAVPPISPAVIEVDYEKFITEDDTPVDNIYSERQHRLLTDALHASWKAPDEQPHLAATDVGLYYAIGEPAIVPDVMLSLGVRPNPDWKEKKNRSYFVWVYGKSPELTLEVVSNLVGGELSTKLATYARIGIIYYVVWDPRRLLSQTPLQCFSLNRKKYLPCEAWFPELELGVTTWQGEYDGLTENWLRFCDGQGNPLATGIERANNAELIAEAAKQQAEAAKQQAKAATQEKQIAEQRAAKFAEKLRALGIDPEQV